MVLNGTRYLITDSMYLITQIGDGLVNLKILLNHMVNILDIFKEIHDGSMELKILFNLDPVKFLLLILTLKD